jgi:glutathione S-transferase
MLTFYFAPNTCALATHIALKDAGAEYQLKRLDFSKAEQQSPAYLKINPKARVPAMVTPRGILTETPAMLAFIAQSFPQARLAPLDDPFAFAELQSFNSYLCSTVHVAHAHKRRGARWADEPSSFADMERTLPKSMTACFDLIENGFLKGPWVMGDAYTIADPYLFTVAQWLEGDGVDTQRLSRVMEHRSRMAERPSVAGAMAEQQA